MPATAIKNLTSRDTTVNGTMVLVLVLLVQEGRRISLDEEVRYGWTERYLGL